MGFLDSYKRLERLCGDIYNREKPISAYINAMLERPLGSSIIQGWDDDLKKLKRYRHIRNRIVHEPGCTESNMCNECDVKWIDNFILRVIDQNDPLALYREAMRKFQANYRQKRVAHTEISYEFQKQKSNGNHSTVWLTMLLIALIALVAVLLYKNL